MALELVLRPERVEQPQRELQLVRAARLVLRADRGQAVRGRPLQPGVPGAAAGTRCACSHTAAVMWSEEAAGSAPRHGPREAGGGRVREREREPAVGQRDRVQPVAQRPRAVSSPPPLGERLERVQRAGGLAAGHAQVGLEPPAEAAVGVAVRVERGAHAGRVAPAEEQLEPPPVQHARVGGQEVGCRLQIDHAPHGPPSPRPRLEGSGPRCRFRRDPRVGGVNTPDQEVRPDAQDRAVHAADAGRPGRRPGQHDGVGERHARRRGTSSTSSPPRATRR